MKVYIFASYRIPKMRQSWEQTEKEDLISTAMGKKRESAWVLKVGKGREVRCRLELF